MTNRLRLLVVTVLLLVTIACDVPARVRLLVSPRPNAESPTLSTVVEVTARVLTRRSFRVVEPRQCGDADAAFTKDILEPRLDAFRPSLLLVCVNQDSAAIVVTFSEASLRGHLLPESERYRKELTDTLRGLASVRVRRP